MNIETAEKIARILHEDQFRADGVTPYIEHPKAVAELVKEYGDSERCVCLAWLHDIMEENAEGTRKFLGLKRIDSKAHFIMNIRSREAGQTLSLNLQRSQTAGPLTRRKSRNEARWSILQSCYSPLPAICCS